MFEMIQAITEDPIPALPPHLFSPELCDFVELTLRRDPIERPSAAKLLEHPFLQLHKGCDDLVDMVQVAPATLPEVRHEFCGLDDVNRVHTHVLRERHRLIDRG